MDVVRTRINRIDKKLTKWQAFKKFRNFHFIIFLVENKNRKNIILVPMIAIDVLNNMLKFQIDWSSGFFRPYKNISSFLHHIDHF